MESYASAAVGIVLAGVVILIGLQVGSNINIGDGTPCITEGIGPGPDTELVNNTGNATQQTSIGTNWSGQRFNTGSNVVGKSINEVTFEVFRDGDPEGDLIVRVRDSDDNIKATLATIDDSTIDTTSESITIDFSPVTIAAGDMITFETASLTTIYELNHTSIVEQGDTITNSAMWGYDGNIWTESETEDLIIAVTGFTPDTGVTNQSCVQAQDSTWGAFAFLPFALIIVGVLLFAGGRAGYI